MKTPDDDAFLHASISPALLATASKVIKNLAYSSVSESDKLDLYLPKIGKKPYPLIVYFHGGAFRFGAKDDTSLEPMLRGLAKGYAVASVSYRLSGEARFPAMILDGKCALRYLHSISKQYDLDEDRFAIWGPSSGGYLVSMLGLTQGNPAFEDPSLGFPDSSSRVRAVIDWCGPVSGFV